MANPQNVDRNPQNVNWDEDVEAMIQERTARALRMREEVRQGKTNLTEIDIRGLSFALLYGGTTRYADIRPRGQSIKVSAAFACERLRRQAIANIVFNVIVHKIEETNVDGF